MRERGRRTVREIDFDGEGEKEKESDRQLIVLMK
jgi:hypothetical protein